MTSASKSFDILIDNVLKKLMLIKISRQQLKHEKLPSMQTVEVKRIDGFCNVMFISL